MNEEIFRAYDIRGIYPQQLDDEAAYKIGQAFTRYSNAKTILVGRDIRLSSESLANSLIEGISSQDTQIIDIGLCSTPCFYFSAAISGADGALMITASHQSKEFNGIKPVFKGNVPLTRKQLIELKNETAKGDFKILSTEKRIINKNFVDEYIAGARSFVKNKFKPFKVIFDAGNGMAGLYTDKIFAESGMDIKTIFQNPDGNFPNHETNPKIPENREKIIDAIKSDEADLGFMFDGDADRVYAFDSKGEIIDPSLVSAIMGEYMVKNFEAKKVLVEVRTSSIVKEKVEAAGGEVETGVCWTIPTKLKLIQDNNFIYGSETSGHYIFAGMHNSDDGIVAALNFLQALSVNQKNLDELIADFKKNHFVIEEKNFKIGNQNQTSIILEKLENKYKNENAQILKIDGLSVKFPDWWFNLRASESEPLIRLNLEAKNEELMNEKEAEVSELIPLFKNIYF